ncbi:hypothetical protein DFA_10523 [Cavenderia fasciculata]|uniref:Uncharacterized protein n=1 Tax=Cavenderia fasciculata TaxID=261658 RepID=F4QAG2_CACFS|nr:uncharacterized protein DFA_10523 [Cavenderia fasciculata]EGG15681.1 hypothetical protein DFA_10523 [Cavenderia fasciculata]|eukprot:XP_004354423.1 hypothetical protein DFA_10523 [Cavenderia fasciculata]
MFYKFKDNKSGKFVDVTGIYPDILKESNSEGSENDQNQTEQEKDKQGEEMSLRADIDLSLCCYLDPERRATIVVPLPGFKEPHLVQCPKGAHRVVIDLVKRSRKVTVSVYFFGPPTFGDKVLYWGSKIAALTPFVFDIVTEYIKKWR